MKKIIFVLFVGLFFNNNVFSKSLDESTKNKILVKPENLLMTPSESCLDYAYHSAYAEEACFGDMTDYEFSQTVDWYYGICNEAGGTPLTPVFIGC